MATIRLSTDEDAHVPSEALRLNLATVSFELDGPSAYYETEEQDVIANALAHPWLEVDFPEVDPNVDAPVEEVPVELSPIPFFDVESGEVVDNPDEPEATSDPVDPNPDVVNPDPDATPDPVDPNPDPEQPVVTEPDEQEPAPLLEPDLGEFS